MLVDCVRRYCYCREEKYYPFDDADLAVRDDFAYRIEVKEKASNLLRGP
jgi:hypothetical protein